jgi:hypothetical protein
MNWRREIPRATSATTKAVSSVDEAIEWDADEK